MKTTPGRNIWIVRHGERADHADPDWKLTAERLDDAPLSNRGHQQSNEIGLALADESIDFIFTSPYTRCLETTSDMISTWKTIPPINVEPGFMESLNDCLSTDGLNFAETRHYLTVNEDYKPAYRIVPQEDGTDAGCRERVGAALRAVLSRFPTGNMVIVTHGSPVAACYYELFGSWRYCGLGTLGKIVQDGQHFHCEFYGSKDHLSNKENLRERQTMVPYHLPLYPGTY